METGYEWMRPSHYSNPVETMWGGMLADPSYWGLWAVSHDPTTGSDGNHPYAQPCACLVGAGPGKICQGRTSGGWTICGRCRPTEDAPPGDCQCDCDACCVPRYVVQEGTSPMRLCRCGYNGCWQPSEVDPVGIEMLRLLASGLEWGLRAQLLVAPGTECVVPAGGVRAARPK